MAITNTTNEAKHGNRETRASESRDDSRQAANASRGGSGHSGSRKKARPTDRPASSRNQAAADGSASAGSIVELTIDIPEEQFLERIARMLLELTEHKSADGF